MPFSTKGTGITIKAIEALRDSIKGRVINPDDAEYDRARTVFHGGIDRRPLAIIRVADADDVARVVSFASETGLELAIRSGGHSVAGHSVSDGGIVLDLSEKKALQIDVEGRTAWAETGLTAGEYTAAAGAHGLATGFGDTGSVGIGGITLAGGIGFLSRKYGLTIDDLLAAEIVTADGQLLQVDPQTHPDLFWAIRGGGGNFGVATRFRFRLHTLPTVVGGMLILPATAQVVSSFLTEAEAADEELTTIANVMTAPPMPFVPEEYHGRLVVMALLTYAGPVEAGERAISPFRALASPIVDMVRPMTYPEMYFPDQEDYHPVSMGHTMFVDGLDHVAVETIIDQLQASTASMAVAQIRVLGGAMSRIPVEDTAFAHRRRKLMATVAAVLERPEQAEIHGPWVTSLAQSLDHDEGGAYVGFLGDEGEERIRAAYPGPTWERLRAVKASYDPNNLFRLNQNIPPR